LNSADPANCIREEASANKEACLLQLVTATTAIENILVNLSAADKSALDSREQYTAQLQEGNKDSRNAEISDYVNNKSASVRKTAPISFNEVVGNMEAKQALYENVILPLTISDLTKARVFSGRDCVDNATLWMATSSRMRSPSILSPHLILRAGIRAGSGNVMLYGPAGTGKTIMCQAAAFEARAELIIGNHH
jgi:SpoVK/Ycf46/Vps4 family AAA+-type ATPase